ncbi:hypothetical protein ACIGG5_00355 [Streptomyces sp. NPDC085463]|uniref:hypothetical protein n=1 Tax=Streptomyces sp. NPDC085463 TaxID=3365724 RepID=UPI0037D66DCE
MAGTALQVKVGLHVVIERRKNETRKWSDAYEGKRPLLDASQRLDDTDVLPPATGTGCAETGDIYAVRFGATEADAGVSGLTNGGVQVTNLGESHDKPVYRTRIDFYCGIALFGGKAAARLTGVLNG